MAIGLRAIFGVQGRGAVSGVIGLGWLAMFAIVCFAASVSADAQPVPAATTHVVLISDIHFDPFQDPAKVALLAASPVAGWKSILDSPPSADRDSAAALVRERCGKDLYDTSSGLFESLLADVATRGHASTFAVVTGDLLTHDFHCRYVATLPGKTPAEEQQFVERTTRYVIESLHRAAGARPVYIALGNNDTDCNDYRLDRDDPLLQGVLADVARAAHRSPVALGKQGYAGSGRFSTLLPAPMHATRLAVLDDVHASNRYTTCAGAPDTQLAEEDLAWLRTQLQEARAQHQSVWFAAHIPPGVYPRSTLFGGNLCTARKPTMFLASDALTDLLAEFADVVKLALFGHTHMDELRLLGAVPAKVIPSVSPISGNRPSYLIAEVDASTATMLDYTQYLAPAIPAGKWARGYSFRQTYEVEDFTAASLQHLLERFAAEPLRSPLAASYVEHYTGGAPDHGIAPVWKAYQCALNHTAEAAFLDCACPASTEVRP